jgi:uncharacterized damage-inducible protein DinB
MNMRSFAVSTLALALTAACLRAQAPASDFRADYLRDVDQVEKKFTSLAEAMPAEKYSWRPEEGVRAVSEVFVHVAGANVGLLHFAGIQPPAGFGRDAEKTVTTKPKVEQMLKQSFAHLRQAAADADLSKPVKLFGRETTMQELLIFIGNHMHEHLGQAIAYARVNGVVPPWSAKK